MGDLGIGAADNGAEAVAHQNRKGETGGWRLWGLAGGGRGGDPVHGHGRVGGRKRGGKGRGLLVLVWGAVKGVVVGSSGGHGIHRVARARVGTMTDSSNSSSNKQQQQRRDRS